MNTILATITVITLSVCQPQTKEVKEDLAIKKGEISLIKNNITYKKAPTKWVKITKKSN